MVGMSGGDNTSDIQYKGRKFCHHHQPKELSPVACSILIKIFFGQLILL
jgi:hypothetical protein